MALPFGPFMNTRSPTWSGVVSFVVSATSQGELTFRVTFVPSADSVPSINAFTDGDGGGVVMNGLNSSMVRIVTTSVGDPLIVGPSWYPVEMLGRFLVVSSSTMSGKVSVAPGGPGR